jgi:type I restriction enzyme M protein
MTLHDAIEKILRETRKSLKAAEIAETINSRRIYIKGDNTNVTSSQVLARVTKYPNLFRIDENGISLLDISIKPYRDLMLKLTDLLYHISPVIDNVRVQELVTSILTLIYFRGNYNSFPLNTRHYKERLITAFKNLEFEHPKLEESFLPIINYISNGLSEFEAEQILILINSYSFESIPKPSQEEFSSFFNDVANTFSWKNNFRGGEFSTPKLVSSLMSSLYELPQNAKVFDPFAGRASLLSELIRLHKNKVDEVFAGDIVENAIAIGVLNIYSTGLKHFDYKKRNAFIDWANSINADVAYSNPPFGGKIENFNYGHEWQMLPTPDLSLNAIQLILYHLSSQGKAIIVVPESVLFGTKKEAEHLREMIVNEDLLQGIILLPNNIFKPYAAVSSAIMIFDKSRRSKSTGIFFYDSSSVPLNEFGSEISNIVDAFHSETSKKDKARWVSKYEIADNRYDLTVKKYLLQSFEGEEFVILRDLVKHFFSGNYVPADNINKEEGIPYIQVGDLNESEGLETVKIDRIKSFISDIEIVSSSIKVIPDQAVLISKVGTKLKPALFEGTFKAVASSNIIVLVPSNDVLPEFLISQLQSSYVQKQIEVIRRYNAIPNFNLKELLNIKIKRLTLEQQRQYVTTYYSRKVADIEKIESRAKEDELYNLISRFKHEIKQPISSIGIDISILLDYITEKDSKKEFISLNDYAIEPLPGQSYSDIEATKIRNILNRIKECVSESQETLRKAEETLNIGKAGQKLELVEIKSFLEKIVIPIYINDKCVIKINGKDQVIKADKYQLKVLFKHLIENAIKHGFDSNSPKDQNIIKIEFTKETQSGFVEIIVMNNGKPFSKGFNKANFETKGNTSNRDRGSGFGGYHIKRIIENHKGEFEIADDEETQFSDFKVKFKIYLPLNS